MSETEYVHWFYKRSTKEQLLSHDESQFGRHFPHQFY